MLPKRIGEDESVVINTQDYLDGGGTHWVCVVNQLDSNDAEYFDSLGVQPSNVVVDYMKTSGNGLGYRDNHIQNVDSIFLWLLCVLCYSGAGKESAYDRDPSRFFETGSE